MLAPEFGVFALAGVLAGFVAAVAVEIAWAEIAEPEIVPTAETSAEERGLRTQPFCQCLFVRWRLGHCPRLQGGARFVGFPLEIQSHMPEYPLTTMGAVLNFETTRYYLCR